MTPKELFFGSDSFTNKQENLRQLVMYPFAGIFTALANFISFVIADMVLTHPIDVMAFGHAFDISLIIKQLVSWVATIVTAHFTNRMFVFRSHGSYILELLGFAAARLLSFFPYRGVAVHVYGLLGESAPWTSGERRVILHSRIQLHVPLYHQNCQ